MVSNAYCYVSSELIEVQKKKKKPYFVSKQTLLKIKMLIEVMR